MSSRERGRRIRADLRSSIGAKMGGWHVGIFKCRNLLSLKRLRVPRRIRNHTTAVEARDFQLEGLNSVPESQVRRPSVIRWRCIPVPPPNVEKTIISGQSALATIRHCVNIRTFPDFLFVGDLLKYDAIRDLAIRPPLDSNVRALFAHVVFSNSILRGPVVEI
jgi:hypothetical protein